MAITYGRKKRKQKMLVHTILVAFLICAVFLAMIASLYHVAEEEAYELLHLQTKQIKDDLVLQIKSDRENLVTMANFAAKLAADGDDYSLLFDSFKPIGLFSGIGILNPDGTFTTKFGTLDLNGKISFAEEAARGTYISGRIQDLTREGKEIIRSAVPIKVDGKIVGMLYGVIPLETIGEKYLEMAGMLDAQLFVYDKESGKYVIDTINTVPGELSELETRQYNDGSSYSDLIEKENGFVSFKSIRTGENLYLHFSTIEDFGWGILLARYENQVFAEVRSLTNILLITFVVILLLIAGYVLLVMRNERRRSRVTAEASEIRKLLLEINQEQNNITESLEKIRAYSAASISFFMDTDGDDYHCGDPILTNLSVEEKRFLGKELLRYAAIYRSENQVAMGYMQLIPNKHLAKTNAKLHDLMKKHGLACISFAVIVDQINHIDLLGVINPKKSFNTRTLLEEIAVCFSIAIYNKNHLNQTEHAATTDVLTGVKNRVAYERDAKVYNAEKPETFSCVFVDVNELHIRNNKYGHAAGDAMLIYIANALKQVFYGHTIYRMGGDEFLVFTKGVPLDVLNEKVERFNTQVEEREYHTAIGVAICDCCENCEELVNEAELRMYEAKARYYQNKESVKALVTQEKNYVQTETGIREIDAMISVLKEHYNGIYRVSLKNDTAHRILMPAYLGYGEYEEHFSELVTQYISDMVHSDYHRTFTLFLNYDSIRQQLEEGESPRIRYKKVDGESVVLTVYCMADGNGEIDDTLWVFAKD